MKKNQRRFLLTLLAALAKGSHLQNCHAGKRVGVALYRRIRGERTFADKDALFAQIREDVKIAKKVLEETKKGVYNSERLC